MAFDYLTGELSSDKASAVEAHLAACDLCRTEFNAVSRTLKALAEPKTMFAPPDVLDAVKSAIRCTKPRMIRVRLGWTVATAVLLLFAGWAGIIRNTNWRVNDGQVVTICTSAESSRRSADVATSGSSADTNVDRTITSGNTAKSTKNDDTLLSTSVAQRKDGPSNSSVRSVVVTTLDKVRSNGDMEQPPAGPTIEYVVVYAPDVRDTARPWADKNIETEYQRDSIETSAYLIQMTDIQSSSVTTLSVQTTVEPDGKPSIALDLGVIGTNEGTNGSERSPSDDGS